MASEGCILWEYEKQVKEILEDSAGIPAIPKMLMAKSFKAD